MNILYLVNYFAFSSLIALFVLEIGIAALSLINYNSYKSVIAGNFKYLWGIVGTFAVFYLVNFESTYPKLILHIATLYELPLLLAAILILVKNTFAAYSEHFLNERKGILLNRIYAIATILSGIIVTGIITSIGSGIAVNLGQNSLNFAQMIFNPFNIIAFLGLALASVFIAYGFSEKKSRLEIAALIGFAMLMASVIIHMPSIAESLIRNIWVIIIESAFFSAAIISYVLKKKYSGFLSVSWILASVFLLGVLQYPYTFGKGINMLQEMTTSPRMGAAIIGVTAVGYALLAGVFILLQKIGGAKRDNS